MDDRSARSAADADVSSRANKIVAVSAPAATIVPSPMGERWYDADLTSARWVGMG